MKYTIILCAILSTTFNLFAAENLDKFLGKYEDKETHEVYRFVKKEVTVYMQHLCGHYELENEFNFDYYSLRNEKGESEFGIYVNQEEGWVYIMGVDNGPMRLKKKNCYDKPELAGKYILQMGTLSLEQTADLITFKNLHNIVYGTKQGMTLKLEWNGELTLTEYKVEMINAIPFQRTFPKRLRKF